MTRLLRMGLVVVVATAALAVIPGAAASTVPGAIDQIVFSSNSEHATWEIYTRDFDGTNPQRLTNNADADYDAMWSPDGTQILFNRSPFMGVIDIMMMNPDGSGQTNLTSSSTAVDVALDWSPDGSRILFASDRSGYVSLWSMHPDGSDPQRLTDNTKEEWKASWSPDGSTIVLDREGDLWLMDADGSNERPLLDREEDDRDPVWSPDGTKIVFTSLQSGFRNIWIVNADGSQPYSLTNTILSNNSEPAWAPDGSKIAFSSDRDGDWDIWMMNPDGTDLGHLTNNPADERFVDWESANRAPIAVNDDGAVVHRGQAVAIDLLSNDSDPDGEDLTLVDITRMPNEGNAAIDPSGTVTYTHNGIAVPTNHVMPYTDSFDYKVEDSRMGSAIGTAQVWIYPYFDDVPVSNGFFDDVVWLAVQRVTQGCNPPDNTLFCPAEFVTRAQMAAFLVRARGFADGGGDDLFTDDNGSVFEVDIDKLGTAGVTRGCNPPVNDRFCPDGLVTRGQMAAFLVRAFQLTDQGRHDLFVDDNVSIFEADIDKLGATGVSKGCNPPLNDRFCPDANVTREQMAAFISRAVGWGQE